MASSLSDKAIFIYDTFFSADITQGQLDSQIKQSSLFRIAFEEVISYPNLLDQMKAHDRYDELIGINTEAYQMISDNATREENSQLEANAFIFITNEENSASDFGNFLNTVSGHIGFGKIINNPRTAYEIASNAHAVDLILGNDEAVAALLNAPNGLTAFGKDATSAQKIFSQDEIFKSLRSSLRFNQYQVLPSQPDNVAHRVRYVGGKYIIVDDNNNYIMVSDDMYNWTKVFHPGLLAFRADARADCIGYDPINKAWFFHTRVANQPPVYTKDFVNWNNVSGTFGNSYGTTMAYFGGKIWCNFRSAANATKIGFISLSEGQESYSITELAVQPGWLGSYGVSPEFSGQDGDYPYMMWTDGGYQGSYIDKYGIYNNRTNSQGNSSWFYLFDSTSTGSRGQRSLTYANENFYVSYYYSASSDTRIGLSKFTFTEEDFESGDNNNSTSVGRAVSYWYHYEGTTVVDVIYKNGVYIASYPSGYATSLNGVVWDKQLFDVTYEFRITDVDERGFVGWVPGTDFVLSSYDATVSSDLTTTTTTTTTTAPQNLPEGVTELECLIDTTDASVLEYNGTKMVFNNKDYYENTNYVVTTGQYKILNVPEEYPIAVLNYGKSQNITYTGDINKKHFSKVVGTDADHVYDFFYGDVTINVKGNFERISLYYYKKPGFTGYLGMEKILVHQDYLSNGGTTAANDTSKVSDTSIYAASVRNFDCVGNEALEKTDLVNIVYTTTTTTATPSYTEIIPPTTTTTTAAPDYGDENYTTGISLIPGTEYSITLDGPIADKLAIDGTTFEDAAAAGNRYVLGVGTYIFNVEADLPIAFENATSSGYFGPQHSNVSYTGDFYKRSSKGINDVTYHFYHGEVILIVDQPFVTLNLVTFDTAYSPANNAFSWDRSTTTTTTLAPATTTTTDPQTQYTRCLIEDVTVTESAGNYLFNSAPYETNTKLGMNTGVYIFRGVPQTHPIAFLNYGKWNSISYTGDPMKSITHLAEDGHEYSYYYGDVTVNVNGDFGMISYDCSNHGYMGGQDRILFSSNCPVAVQPTTTAAPTTTTTTTVEPNSITTTSTTTTTTRATTTTTTTAAPTSAEYCLVSGSQGNIVTYDKNGQLEYVFNGNSGLYGMTTGTYTFKNVSASHPIAFLNFGKTNLVTYSGQYNAGNKQGVDGNQYSYYYGDVTVTISGDFGFLSYECYYHGYMGGQNNIIYDNTTCS